MSELVPTPPPTPAEAAGLSWSILDIVNGVAAVRFTWPDGYYYQRGVNVVFAGDDIDPDATDARIHEVANALPHKADAGAIMLIAPEG